MKHPGLCMVAIALALTPPISIHAQQTINNATLGGLVLDPQSRSVAGAAVTATQLATNLTHTAITNTEGRFRFPYLAIGPYRISVMQSGFSTAQREVNLTVGADFQLRIALSIPTAQTSVEVSGTPPIVETNRSEIAETISRNEVQNLSLLGRNFLDLALLTPGVSPTNTASTQLFAETSAVPGQGYSINSQRNFSNSFVVDGLSANDDAAGLTGTFYGLDTVSEFQLVTSGGQAEFGRALGGYASMVTRSGTDEWHGSLYGFLRNQQLNAANALSHTTLPLTQAQYGASIGGPLIHRQTFIYANLERKQLNQSGIVTITPQNVAIINTRLKAAGYPGPQIATGIYPNPIRTNNAFARLDHRFNPRDQFDIHYNLYTVDNRNSRGVGALSATSAAAALHDTDHTVAISNIATLSPSTVNETRGQFMHSSLTAPPNDPVGPAVSISGVASFGTLSFSPQGRLNRLYEVVDNISHQAGAHSLRAGADFLYNDLKITFPQSARGSYSFSSLSNFLAGTYNALGFTQSFGNSIVTQGNPNLGIYAQDEWKLSHSFTLNAGLRYDLQFLKAIATDTNNISPRIGFAWSPFHNDRTLIRASYGLFYDRVPLRALSNALQSSGNTTNINASTFVTVNLSPTQAGAPTFPNTASSLPAGVRVNFTTMDPHMQNAYSQQASLQVEQQLSGKSSLSISYQHVRGLKLIASINQNVPTCIASGNNNGCRPDSTYGNNKQYRGAADSYYDGLSVSLVQRPSQWGSYRIAYTWSKAINDAGEFFFSSPINNFNIAQDRGRSDDDQRHRVVFSGVVHTSTDSPAKAWARLRNGFLLSGILQYYSALPFNITTGANSIQGTAMRPCTPGILTCAQLLPGTVIGRNSGNGFDSFTLNTRLSRTFHLGEHINLEGIAEAFNSLNHRNDLIPNGTFGSGIYPAAPSPSFGRANAVGDPRQIQMALRLSF